MPSSLNKKCTNHLKKEAKILIESRNILEMRLEIAELMNIRNFHCDFKLELSGEFSFIINNYNKKKKSFKSKKALLLIEENHIKRLEEFKERVKKINL